MPIYTYKAQTGQGETITAKVEADTTEQVRAMLSSRGLRIISIDAPKTGAQMEIKLPGGNKVPPKEVALFSRQMATLIEAGVPIAQALEIMRKQTEHAAMRTVIATLRRDVESGLEFSAAMENHPKVFPKLFINLIRAGEVSGAMETVLGRLATFLEKDLALKGQLKSAMTYPASVMVLAIGITYFLLTTIVPQFAGILVEMNAPMPPITKMLMAVSAFLQTKGIFLGIGVAAVVVAYQQAYKRPDVRSRVDAIKIKLPVFGPLVRKTALARFTRTLALLVQAGVMLNQAIAITKGVADLAPMEEALQNAEMSVMTGEAMSSALAAATIFPPMVVSMTAIGEETGSIDSMMEKMADFYDQEVEQAIESMTAMIEPIMIVFLGTIVGTIVAGMFLPMFSIIGSLS